MRKLFPYLFLLIFSFSKAQNTREKQIDVLKKINKIDSTKTTLVRKFKIEIDSVRINISDYTNVVEGEGYIGKSQNKFKVTYYLSSNKLEGIITKEMIQGDLYMQWIFNVVNDKIRNEFPSHTVSMCVPVAMNKSLFEIYSYNKSWTEKYLKKVVMKLFEDIKNYR